MPKLKRLPKFFALFLVLFAYFSFELLFPTRKGTDRHQLYENSLSDTFIAYQHGLMDDKRQIHGTSVDADILLTRNNNAKYIVHNNLRRPTAIIHTFFQPLSPLNENKEEDKDYSSFVTGATVDENVQLVEAWKKAWESKGWMTKVLTMEDVESHYPNFIAIKEKIEALEGVNAYNKLCFYRWFAMAAVGGGWMSDYDAFPLNFDANTQGRVLPNQGKFTAYQSHVPSLLSGTKEEWDRMANLILDTAQEQHRNQKYDLSNENESNSESVMITDMLVFQSCIKENDDAAIVQELGKYVRDGFRYVSPGIVDCEMVGHLWAIHLSHSSVKKAVKESTYPIILHDGDGRKSEVEAIRRRAEAALAFLLDWSNQCSDAAHVSDTGHDYIPLQGPEVLS